MNKILILLLFSFLYVLSHLCMIDPPQRGELAYEIPGEEVCFRPFAQCGKQPPQAPKVKYVAGTISSIIFQQNYNHWTAAKPGIMDISVSYKVDTSPLTDADFTQLVSISDFPANEMVNQQNFTINVKWPKKTCDHCVLRLRYITNNPDEASKDNPNGIFYQCVDISIVANAGEENIQNELPQTPLKTENKPLAPYSCCTVKQFTAKAEGHYVTKGETFEYTIYYDYKNKMARWDQSFFDLGQNLVRSWSLYTNYNTLLEYIYSPATNSCEPTGPDAIYDWCYGNTDKMIYQGKKPCNDATTLQCDVWLMDNGMHFYAFSTNGTSTCKPFATFHQDTNGKYTFFMRFYYFAEGISDPHVFDLPDTCHRN